MILLPSSKTMNPSDTKDSTKVHFENKSLHIRKYFQNMSKDEIGDYFKVKGKVLDKTYSYYQEPVTGIAIKSMQGQVMKQIKTINIEYIKNNVFILDAMYGIINGYDKIELFRLDFTLKSIIDKSYYAYWSKEVNDYIQNHNNNQILLLTSDEYSKLINHDMDNKNIYNLHFSKEIKSSVIRKQIRGKVCNYCIQNEIKDYKLLDNVEIEDFQLQLIDNKILVKAGL